MNLDMVIRGALAALPDVFQEVDLLHELQRRGFTLKDARLALTKAVMEGFISTAVGSTHTKLDRARMDAEPGRIAEP